MGDLRGGGDKSWRSRAEVAGDYPISTAVAASSAFPGAFSPVELPKELLRGAESLLLADGGVFDNQGITTLEAEECDYSLVSDGSVPFTMIAKPRSDVIGLALRSIEISGKHVRARALGAVPGVVFQIGLQEGEDSELARTVQGIGTSLKKLPEDRLRLIVARGTTVAQDELTSSSPTELAAKLAANE
jgi:NTE family protein